MNTAGNLEVGPFGIPKPSELPLEHFSIQKQRRGKCLALRGGRDDLFGGEKSQALNSAALLVASGDYATCLPASRSPELEGFVVGNSPGD